MLQDLVINLSAAAIAFLMGLFTRSFWARLRRRRENRRQIRVRQQRRPDFAVNWIIDYYRRRDHLDDLYSIRIGDRKTYIPFLALPWWQIVDQDESELLDQSLPHARSGVEIDRRIVASRLAKPEEIDNPDTWNDLHACVRSVTASSKSARISVFVSDFFQYVTVCGALEDETYAAVEKPGRRTPIRDAHLPSAAQAAQCGMGAHSIGMTVALVFRQRGVHKVLIQERSHEVSTYGGGLGVVPMFGCQTLDLSSRTSVSLIHNYLREVYEELYGGNSVEQPNLRVDPRWFLAEPEMRYVVEKMARDELRLRLLGFGFDAINGQLIIGGLSEIQDESFAETELPKLIGNWEIRRIYVWDLFGAEMSEALLTHRFTPACAFTLAQTRELVNREAESCVEPNRELELPRQPRHRDRGRRSRQRAD